MSRFDQSYLCYTLYFLAVKVCTCHHCGKWLCGTIFDVFILHRKGPSAVQCSSIKWRHRKMLAVFSGCTEPLLSYKDSVSFFEILRYVIFLYLQCNIGFTEDFHNQEMDIYFKHIRDYYCSQGFQCDNDHVSDIIK